MKRQLLIFLVALAAALVNGSSATALRPDVEKAQVRLNRLGCNAGPTDGVLGPWTRSAIVRFQAAAKLSQNGSLNADTRDRLYSNDAPSCRNRPVPPNSGSGRRIVISQRQNWVWLVASDGSVKRQGGMVDNTSLLRPGRYRTGSYCGRSARIIRNRSASGSLYLENFVRFAPCGIGFHRVPTYVSNGNQIHPNYIVGTNLAESHGCIRLTQSMSRQVWLFTSARTEVRVVVG
jgi:hypothetical protein